MDNLFEPPNKAFHKRLLKAYDESKHPRDQKGRWTAGGVARGALAGGAALAGAAALGIPGVRSLPGLRNIRRAVIGARTRAAQGVVRNPEAAMRRAVPGFRNLSPAALRGAAGAAMSPIGRFERPATSAFRSLTGTQSPAARRRAMAAFRARSTHAPTGRR